MEYPINDRCKDSIFSLNFELNTTLKIYVHTGFGISRRCPRRFRKVIDSTSSKRTLNLATLCRRVPSDTAESTTIYINTKSPSPSLSTKIIAWIG